MNLKTFFQLVLPAVLITCFTPCLSAQELRAAAASDLTKAFTEVANSYQRRTGQKVALIFGSSGLLSKQIENGAPFDVFASANVGYIDSLDAKRLLLPGTKAVYGQGHIGLWTRRGVQPVPVRLEDLLSPRYAKIALANPQFAPYGQAAREALQKEHLWDRLQSRFVYGENIQQTFQFAESGNADVGIVSQSLAAGSGGNFRAIPDALYPPLRQALGILKTTHQEENARRFTAFVTGPEGQAILKRFGLALPKTKPTETKGTSRR